MALTLAEKQTVVTEVATIASKALSVIAAEYRGLTVEQLTTLRIEARKAGVYLRVVKNTLAQRALEGTEFSCMKDGLVGPLILGFSLEDPGAMARIAATYAKNNDKFQVRLIAFGGKLLPPEDLSVLASMPTYDQAISKLIGVIQAPIAKLVRTVNEVPSKLVRTVAAIREVKEQT
ncbi:50S ribosomal protein L10 [Achromatium sp. WMS3]|nr:50S ribosomal protein L10 [Achromatium sp. WMS3]